HVRAVANDLEDRLANLGIEVDRVEKAYFRVFRSQLRDGAADVLEAFAEILASMAGDQDDAGVMRQKSRNLVGQGGGRPAHLRGDLVEGVDTGITRDLDSPLGHSLPIEVFGGARGRRKVEVRDESGYTPIQPFWK